MKQQLILLLFLIVSIPSFAQKSKGGVPLFPQPSSLLRALPINDIIEMPPFDIDSARTAHNSDARSFRFAHKLETHIERGRDGMNYTLPDGTRVWQVTIRSADAYSLNLLFSEYHVPPGARLFIYNQDHSHVIGAFTDENNSEAGLLPTRPVAGDEITIEYTEPGDAAFEGRLTISEVNHDYLDMLRKEPGADLTTYYKCMPDALCNPNADPDAIRASVLFTIDGIDACSGTLINNTLNDETPYLLTATHCLNDNMSVSQDMDYYVSKAGTIVAFFNYTRPVCGTTMKATEEMSLAVCYPRVILEDNDIALLEFQQAPPDYYNIYYSGWDVTGRTIDYPYHNLHHPNTGVTKYGVTNQSISIVTYPSEPPGLFASYVHWKVNGWNTGSTHGGSSGSALYNKDWQIVGGLSGGNSRCSSTKPNGLADYFFALHKGWNNNGEASNQLKTYLDPNSSKATKHPGFDPNATKPFHRLSNVEWTFHQLDTTRVKAPNTGFLFGNNNTGTKEYAEAFLVNGECQIVGVYLFSPSMDYYTSVRGVTLHIYAGDDRPTTLLASKEFLPSYLAYSSSSFGQKEKTTNRVATESFVLFDEEVTVTDKFFVAYEVNSRSSGQFAVFNTPHNSKNTNHAWIKSPTNDWISADQYPNYKINTSLALQPLVRNLKEASIDQPEATTEQEKIYFDRDNRLLHLPSDRTGEMELYVYSIDGKLLEKSTINETDSIVRLHDRASGTVAIVKIGSEQEVYSVKILY